MSKPSSGSGKAPSDGKKARLAQALRDNLKRRKEQAKSRKEERKDDLRGQGDSPEAGEKRPGGRS